MTAPAASPPPARRTAPDVRLFDCSVGVGESGYFSRSSITAPADLLALLDRYGIEDALLYDQESVETAHFDRDAFILGFCAASPRLHPSVTLVPPGTGERPEPETWVASLVESGVRAVRAWPAWHQYDFLPYCLGPLLDVLQRRRLPLFVNYFSTVPGWFPWGHTPNWDHIQRTAAAFPALPIVVLHTGMLNNRRLFPLLRACPNVHCDITGTADGFLEQVCADLGPEQLLFTGEFPIFEPGLLVPWVRYAEIPEAAARLIAGDNLRRLLAEVR